MRSLLPLLFLAVSTAAAQGPAPGTRWPTATPASVGLNGAVLDSLDREIKSGRYGYIDRMVVIRHGKIAFDGSYAQDYDAAYGDSARTRNGLTLHDLTGQYNYYNPWWHPTYRRGDLHSLQSVTKTVTSVILGVAVTRGDFPSIDRPVLSFYDTTAVQNIDDRKRRMTIRHLLTMTGGIDWNENLPYTDPGNTTIGLEKSYDWVDFTINRPMMREPGTLFNYNSGESVLLADIFRKATATDIEEYAARHLFAPLGIERWYWKRSPAGLIDTEGGLYLEARDLARIWYLFSQDGNWNGTRVLSSDWIRQSITPAIDVGSATSGRKYGLKWWLYANPTDPGRWIWGGSGFGGQFPLYFPDQDMVVVFNAWNVLNARPSLPLRTTMERLIKATR